MYTCNHCKKKFNNVPFLGSNNKNYCSLDCIPDSVMDKPYSYEYFNLVEIIRDIQERMYKLKYLQERLELENDIKYEHTKYTVDMWGDDEGLYYKKAILNLLPTFYTLFNKVNNVFMDRTPETRPAAVIKWSDFNSAFNCDFADKVFLSFKEKIEAIHFKNVWVGYDDYRTELESFNDIDKLTVNNIETAKKIKTLFIEAMYENKDLLPTGIEFDLDEISEYIRVVELQHCNVCGEWEDPDCFTFDEVLNVNLCGQWWKCYDGDNPYETEDEWLINCADNGDLRHE